MNGIFLLVQVFIAENYLKIHLKNYVCSNDVNLSKKLNFVAKLFKLSNYFSS